MKKLSKRRKLLFIFRDTATATIGIYLCFYLIGCFLNFGWWNPLDIACFTNRMFLFLGALIGGIFTLIKYN